MAAPPPPVPPDAPALVAVDGSDRAIDAARHGLALLGPDRPVVVATVIDPIDPMLVTGTGFAGGTMSPETFDETNRLQEEEGRHLVDQAVAALGLDSPEVHVVRGEAGPTICDLAAELGAAVVVVGSQGRSGLARAVLGSVSDHVVRNAHCPVVVTGPHED